MKWVTTVGDFLAAQKQGQGLRVQFTVWDENDIRAHTLIGGGETPVVTSTVVEEGGTKRVEDMVWQDITILGNTTPQHTLSFYHHTLSLITITPSLSTFLNTSSRST